MKKESSNYFAISLPKFNFKESSANGLLVLSLVIFSFLLGMLTNKVIYLEQALNAPTPAPAQQEQAAAPTPPPVVPDMKAGKLPLLGNKDAKVTVVEFSDFQCPYCKKYFDETRKQIDDTYIKTGKIKFSYRHYPLNSIHPNAQNAGEASECANEQGKFWEYHDLLFENQETWSPLTDTNVLDVFANLASQLGLNVDAFRACVESNKYQQAVEIDTEAGNKAQVDATPTFFVNGVRVIGAVPFADLKKVIDEELKK